MNNSSFLRILLKFVIIWVLQIVVLKQFQFWPVGTYHYEVFVYPLFMLLLPVCIHINLMLIIAFVAGLIMDGAYNTLGVHAASSIFLAYCRNAFLSWVVPRGLDDNLIPSLKRLDFFPFLRYATFGLLTYLVFYYSMVFFSPFYFIDITIKTLLSFTVSIFFTLILAGVLNGLD